MIPTPYLALGGAVALVAAATGGYFHGKNVMAGEVAARDLKAVNDAEAKRIAAERRVAELETANTKLERERRETVREIYREIPRIIQADPATYGRVCITADGVRLVDRARASAIGGAAGASAGEAGSGGRADDSAVRKPANQTAGN